MRPVRLIEVSSELGAGTRGASLGVKAMRAVAQEFQRDLFHRLDTVSITADHDVLFSEPHSLSAKYLAEIKQVIGEVCDTVSQTLTDEQFPLILAGDHSTAAGTILGVKRAIGEKRLGVIWIDAHADLHTPYTTPSGNVHGMPVAMAAAVDNLSERQNSVSENTKQIWEELKNMCFEGAKFDLRDFVLISGRDLEDQELKLIDQHQALNITVEQLRKQGISETVGSVFDHLAGCDAIYISFDVDSMDPSVSLGTGTPVPGGLSAEEAVELNRLLILNKKVLAWEMVEINPLLDTKNKMARVGFDVLETVIASYTSRESIEPELNSKTPRY
jgi:arginase